MERLRRWGRRFTAVDTALGWAERVYLLYMLGISTIVGAVGGVITWIIQNFVYGLLAFFGIWTLVTALQAFRVVRRFPTGATTTAEPESGAISEPGLSAQEIAERRIANRSVRILDLLRIAGSDDSTIDGWTFEICTILGPGVITTAALPRPPEKGRGNTAIA